MLGAITGDIVGSVYEWDNIRHKDFEFFSPEAFFTDDTVLTVALAEAILENKDYGQLMKEYYQRYPDAGYGGRFHHWAQSDDAKPYNSWGNGSAMRTSPVGFAYNNLDEVLAKAEYFAAFTHNHPEGVKGAQATAAAIFLARTGTTKPEIRDFITSRFNYDLSRTLDEIRPTYKFNESCRETVPEAITAFLEATDFEDAIRNAISLGGDSDTLACITGGIAEGFYGLPNKIKQKTMSFLDEKLKGVVTEFYRRFGHNIPQIN